MPIIPWRPFSDLDKFFNDDEWLFPVWQTKNEPAMDVYETEKEVVAKVNLPGIDPEKIEISVENGFLRISGKIEEEKEEKKRDYYRKEIRHGSFERVVKLPTEVKEKEIEATYDKGVLEIVMPKQEKAKTERKIKVKIKK
jgi:HSP20 family protein